MPPLPDKTCAALNWTEQDLAGSSDWLFARER